MKKGQLILGAASLAIAILGSFAFKTTKRFKNANKRVIGLTSPNGSQCMEICRSLRTFTSGTASFCITGLGGTAYARNGKTWFTSKWGFICLGPTTNVSFVD